MTKTAAVEFQEVRKAFAGRPVLDGLTLAVEAGETVALIGPSGCGKTTALKLVNRLLDADSGRVLVEGRDVAREDAIALRRKLGYVIQEGGFCPHWDVRSNVEVVPRMLGWDEERRARRCREVLAMVNLPAEEFGPRRPRQLSGGQRQRVGVARALAADPPVLLMDEPFGALDPMTRAELRAEFRRIQQKLKKTVIIVTHDMAEAFALGDRVRVINAGRLVACDTRTTIAGMQGLDAPIAEPGVALGVPPRQLLRLVELPLALPSIVAGVRVAAVVGVGSATIAAAIGAGGLGEYIYRGLSMVDTTVILAGAIPAAALAVLVDTALLGVERQLSAPRPARRFRRLVAVTAASLAAVALLSSAVAARRGGGAVVVGLKKFP